MSECTNLEFRDQLTDLLHGSLGPEAEVRLRSHLAVCEQCREELELLELASDVIAADAPGLNVSAIVAALPRPGAAPVGDIGASTLRLETRHTSATANDAHRQTELPAARQRTTDSLAFPPGVTKRKRGVGRRLGAGMALAAALGLGAIGVWNSGGFQLGEIASVSETEANSGLAFAGAVSDLTDEALIALLDDLDTLEPVPAAEPDPGQGSFTGLEGD